MKKSIIGIILVVAAVCVAVIGIMAGGSAPANQEIIKNAVYQANAEVLPENEGKVVVVNGTLNAALPFVDEQTGIELDSIVAYRHVEKARVDVGGSDEDDTWAWDNTINENDLGGSKKLVAPGVTIGEFAVAEELLQPVPTFAELDVFNVGDGYDALWYVHEEKNVEYLYQLEHMPWNGDVVYRDTATRDNLTSKQKNEGTLRVRYDVVEDGTSLDYTIIGLQKGGKLEKVQDLDMIPAVEGHLTVEDLLAQAESDATTSVVVSVAIAVVLAGVGALLIIKSKKRG